MPIEAAHGAEIFQALGTQLETLTEQTVEVVICGGAALQILGFISRPTNDVDVLAIARSDENGITLSTAQPLPSLLAEAAARVGRDFGLAADWFNAGPTSQLTAGLPDGLIDRLHHGSGSTQRFGICECC